MEWISVEERIPEHGKSVLVCYSDGDVHIDTFGSSSFYGYILIRPGRIDKRISCTHWMPLPEPPEK